VTTLAAHDLVLDIPGRRDGEALTFAVRSGETWGVLGPNGAGKTTLLHTLAGLRTPRRGGVQLDQRPLPEFSRRQIARQLALVFQDQHDSFPATVLETVLIGRHPHLSPWDLDRAEDLAIARDAIARVDLAGIDDRSIATLSGGERQRVSVATALAQQPRIWLVDEPTNHLDLRHQSAVLRLLREQAETGCAVCLSLHDLNVAARWCDHILLLGIDGTACWGPVAEMLVPEALERLYGQRLAVAEVAGAPVFVPVS
jgi:iron complex transport system ATP-binding protein